MIITNDITPEATPYTVAQLKQMLDELDKGANMAFNLQGTCSLIEDCIDGLPMGTIKGQTILKARAHGFITSANHAIYEIYSRLIGEVTALQVTLAVMTGEEGQHPDAEN